MAEISFLCVCGTLLVVVQYGTFSIGIEKERQMKNQYTHLTLFPLVGVYQNPWAVLLTTRPNYT
jgi:hypothetical protein